MMEGLIGVENSSWHELDEQANLSLLLKGGRGWFMTHLISALKSLLSILH